MVENIFILTFDIEEWFHILDIPSIENPKDWDRFHVRIYDNTYRILTILDENNIKATFFVLGWIAEKYPDLVKYISDKGHDIGSHSYKHILIYKSSPDRFKYDVLKSIDLIESIINKKVVSFRAPGFSITNSSLWSLEILAEIGIKNDSSIFPAKRGHGGISKFNLDQPFLWVIKNKFIKEYPINMMKYGFINIPFSGGGYFRILPYNILKYFTKKSKYMMTYFHPRDFDKNQPILTELSFTRKIKCYYGLSSAIHKLNKLIKEYKFIDIPSAEKLVDWNSVPIMSTDMRNN